MAETLKNKYGFPVQTCTRCGGTGQFSFNMITGSTCFGCGGSGFQIKGKKAREAFTAYVEATRGASTLTAKDLQVGDKLSHEGFWRTVVAIEWTAPKGVGLATSGDTQMTRLGWVVTVTFKDDSTRVIPADRFNVQLRTRRNVDIKTYLARAGVK